MTDRRECPYKTEAEREAAKKRRGDDCCCCLCAIHKAARAALAAPSTEASGEGLTEGERTTRDALIGDGSALDSEYARGWFDGILNERAVNARAATDPSHPSGEEGLEEAWAEAEALMQVQS
jgi:hypothetical protein